MDSTKLSLIADMMFMTGRIIPGAERFVEKWLDLRMRKYKYILVPDFDEPNLSGRLSHQLRYRSKDKIKYIGTLILAEFVFRLY